MNVHLVKRLDFLEKEEFGQPGCLSSFTRTNELTHQ